MPHQFCQALHYWNTQLFPTFPSVVEGVLVALNLALVADYPAPKLVAFQFFPHVLERLELIQEGMFDSGCGLHCCCSYFHFSVSVNIFGCSSIS